MKIFGNYSDKPEDIYGVDALIIIEIRDALIGYYKEYIELIKTVGELNPEDKEIYDLLSNDLKDDKIFEAHAQSFAIAMHRGKAKKYILLTLNSNNWTDRFFALIDYIGERKNIGNIDNKILRILKSEKDKRILYMRAIIQRISEK
jgi:hypothetical protein